MDGTHQDSLGTYILGVFSGSHTHKFTDVTDCYMITDGDTMEDLKVTQQSRENSNFALLLVVISRHEERKTDHNTYVMFVVRAVIFHKSMRSNCSL